jgi:hypothetical protein
MSSVVFAPFLVVMSEDAAPLLFANLGDHLCAGRLLGGRLSLAWSPLDGARSLCIFWLSWTLTFWV